MTGHQANEVLVENPGNGQVVKQLLGEQVQRLYLQSRYGLIAFSAASLLLIPVLWGTVTHWLLIGWLCLQIGVQVFRFWLELSFRSAELSNNALIAWGRTYSAATGVSGLLWGAAGLFLVPLESFPSELFLVLLLASVSALSAVTYAPFTECYLPTVPVILIPSAGKYFFEGTAFGITVGAAILLLAACLTLMARHMHLVGSELLMLKLDKDRLIDSLRREKASADALDEDLKTEMFERRRIEDELKKALAELERVLEERRTDSCRADEALKQEIDDRQRIGEVLREREKLLQSILEACPVGIGTVESGKVGWANTAMLQIFGYDSGEDLVGRHIVSTLSSREELERVRDVFDRTLRAGRAGDTDALFMRKDGSTFHGHIRVSAPDPSDPKRLTVAAIADITERKGVEEALRKAHHDLERQVVERTAELSLSNEKLRLEISERLRFEKALHDSERRYRLLVETAKDVIWTLDMDLRHTYVSPSVSAVLGYSADEIMVMSPLDVMTPASRSRFLDACLSQMTGKNDRKPGEPISRTVEIEQRHKTGTSLWMEVTITLLRDRESRPVGIHGISRDITERKEAAERLERALSFSSQLRVAAEAANRAKNEFLANMSHELRTPLNAIIGFSEILEDRSFGSLNDKQAKAVSHIAESGRHLLKLINDILDLAKLESGKMTLQISRVRVRDLLDNCLSMIRGLVCERRFSIDVQVSDELEEAAIDADEVKLKQILINLLSNAVKFTPDGGSISLGAEREEDEIIISVSDTGVGIEVEDRMRIFETFEQVDSSYSRPQTGTGLGLALTRKLVEMHGGRIWVDSTGTGKGSTFAFSIPAPAA